MGLPGYTDYPTGTFSSYIGRGVCHYDHWGSGPSGYCDENYPSFSSRGTAGDSPCGDGPPGGGAPGVDGGFPSGRPLGPQGPPAY